jgi:hypothetical protein
MPPPTSLSNSASLKFTGADCLLLHRGSLNEDNQFPKVIDAHLIVGYELPDNGLLSLAQRRSCWF